MRIPIIAIKPVTHRGRAYPVGEVFDVAPIDAAALVYQRKAKFAPRGPRAPTPEPDPPKPRRRYKRRDMRPEP